MDAHLADLQSAEDKVVKIVAIAAKVAGAMADDSVPQEELAKDAEVTLEQAKLQQLCLYQLILGYRLREAEATGSADEQIGR